MHGIMNENQLTIFKDYEFDKSLIQKIDSKTDKSLRDCHKIYFPTIEYICEDAIKLTIITNNEAIDITIFDKRIGLFELSKKLTVARQKTYIFIQKKTNNKKL